MQVLFVIFLFLSFSDGHDEYEGFKLLEVNFSENRVENYLRNIEQNIGFKPDFLGENWKKKEAYYFVDKYSASKISQFFLKNNITFKLKNLDPSIFKVRRKRNQNKPVEITDINSRYLSYEEQIQYLRNLSSRYPNLIKLQNLGNSYENRTILAARIGEDKLNKPIVWIDAGIHAREWISHSAALYTINELVTNSTYHPLLKLVQLVIVTNTNPDGYEFSRNSKRMWRKTRSLYASTNSMCAGADGNRNYPFDWAGDGVSRYPCSEIYCGTKAQSEPEVFALTSAIQREVSRIQGYLSLHSYGQEILYPWGHRVKTYPPDVKDLQRVGTLMANAIHAVNGNEYKVVNSGDGLYPASGASDDWAKSIGIKYSFTIELSPIDDLTGFELPENRIFQVNIEAFQAILTLIRQVGVENSSIRTQSKFVKRLRAFKRTRSFGKGR